MRIHPHKVSKGERTVATRSEWGKTAALWWATNPSHRNGHVMRSGSFPPERRLEKRRWLFHHGPLPSTSLAKMKRPFRHLEPHGVLPPLALNFCESAHQRRFTNVAPRWVITRSCKVLFVLTRTSQHARLHTAIIRLHLGCRVSVIPW